MNQLIKYEAALPFYIAARKALVKARSVDEVLKIKNTAEAARVYALQANDDEMVNNAVEIKLHAKQRAGQMLVEGKKTNDLAAKGQPEKKCTNPSTLSQVGITRNESSDWQKLAAVPEKVLEKAITVVKERDGVLTEAAVKRELPKPHPIAPIEKKLPDINQFITKVCARLDGLLTEEGDRELSQWLAALTKNVGAMHEPAKHSMRHAFKKLIQRAEAAERKFQ